MPIKFLKLEEGEDKRQSYEGTSEKYQEVTDIMIQKGGSNFCTAIQLRGIYTQKALYQKLYQAVSSLV